MLPEDYMARVALTCESTEAGGLSALACGDTLKKRRVGSRA